MQGDDDSYGSPLAHTHHPRLRHTTIPYSSSSIASCASASATSVWSNVSSASSQSTDDASDYTASAVSSQTSVSSVSSNDSVCAEQQSVTSKIALTRSWQQQQPQKQHRSTSSAPQRQNPRRTGGATAAVPSLLRQNDRRSSFVDHLVDASTQIVQAIWPLSSVMGRGETAASSAAANSSYLLPLRTFIQETLRRSRASYSTLQVALYYLLLIKPRLPSHNFTMEQPSDSHACRALQCGRRMFLAALILASKYLQDRNYSARAWSKISGLSTAEINQNETAFLDAVNWRLHITNEVYNRWTDCVSKFNPPQLPPSPGPAVVECFERKCEEFRGLIQKLNPALDNLDDLCAPCTPVASVRRRSSSCQMVAGSLSPVSLCASPETILGNDTLASNDTTPTAKSVCVTPGVMEPTPAAPASFTPGRLAPAMGLLPTPKLAPPHPGVFSNTPAAGVSVAQMMAGRRPSMCYAVAQASTANTTQFLDRWPPAMSSSSTSPVGCMPTRRSSLANSVSTASSPESMISDSSLVSRSSSVSSAWSLMNAPSSSLSKLDAQARQRYGKQQYSGSAIRDKNFVLRPNVIPAVREDYEDEDDCCSSAVFESPETIYTGPVGKDVAELPMSLGRRSSDVDATDAARVLAELQHHFTVPAYQQQTQPAKAGLKRSRPLSIEKSLLQDNVRDLLRNSVLKKESSSLESMVSGQPTFGLKAQAAPAEASAELESNVAARAASLTGSRKRLCRTTAVAPAQVTGLTSCSYDLDLQHPSMSGLCGPGMWQGILN